MGGLGTSPQRSLGPFGPEMPKKSRTCLPKSLQKVSGSLQRVSGKCWKSLFGLFLRLFADHSGFRGRRPRETYDFFRHFSALARRARETSVRGGLVPMGGVLQEEAEDPSPEIHGFADSEASARELVDKWASVMNHCVVQKAGTFSPMQYHCQMAGGWRRTPVQMGGVLLGFPFLKAYKPGRYSDTNGGVLLYKLEVYCSPFSETSRGWGFWNSSDIEGGGPIAQTDVVFGVAQGPGGEEGGGGYILSPPAARILCAPAFVYTSTPLGRGCTIGAKITTLHNFSCSK